MIKVLQFIPGYKFGGIETVFMNNFQTLDKEKINLELVVEELADVDAINKLQNLGCKVYTIPRLKLRNIFNYVREINMIFKDNSYDIVHSYNITRTPIFFLISSFYKVKSKIYHARTNKSSEKLLYRILFRILIIIGSYLSTNRLANSEESGDYFFGKKNYKVLYNGIDVRSFIYDSTLREEVRLKLNINDGFVIGHVGRFTYAKNHPFILEVFHEFQKKYPNSYLLLVGDGPLKSEIKKNAEKLNIQDKVIFTGEIDKVSNYYFAMDLFLFPSKYEGFGNVLIEAQASGLKCIASDKVPQATKASELVIYLKLGDSMEWMEQIISNMKYERKDISDIMKKSGYDINDNTKALEEIYVNLTS